LKFWNATEAYGVVQYAEAVGSAIYIYGLIVEDPKTRTLGRMVVQSLTYSGLTAMFIRMIAGRKRPPFTDDPINFLGFTTDNNYQSFPSGHTTVAFALSTIMAEYLDSPWSRIGFYSIAGLSAVERLINSQHWFSDVAIGASLGIISALHVLKEESNRKNSLSKSRLSVFPSLNGFTFQYRLN
jgi:membrane-associated phospholipid phosphatase